MAIKIKYIKQFTKEYKDFIIVLSKLSELKNIDNLPFNTKLLYKNQTLEKNLDENHYYESYVESNNGNFFYKIKLLLLKTSSKDKVIFDGANLFGKFNKNSNKDLNFIFSSKLLNNYNKLCSDFIFGLLLKDYSFVKYKKENNAFKIESINIFCSKNRKIKEIDYNHNLLQSINFTKDLVSEPANVLNPVSYAKKCLSLRKLGLKVKVLDKSQLEKIGMRSLLGVSQGSHNEPRVVIFEWNLKKNIKPTILVGKGVTFDTGGISLKPSGGMEEMITDMGGSAVVVGSMMNAALNNIKKPIVGIIGLVENMPDGMAQRPGDIVESLSGQTIEVLNTDAEGRLVLADILTYVQNKYKAKEIIDFATLTGAIMVALGVHRAGLFSNNDKLSNRIFKSGEITSEKVWRLPIGDEYDKDINSTRADMQNIGSRYGGSITAAQFIKRFIVNDTAWAHIDIAGVSWTKKGGLNSFSSLHTSGATAFGVRLIDSFFKK